MNKQVKFGQPVYKKKDYHISIEKSPEWINDDYVYGVWKDDIWVADFRYLLQAKRFVGLLAKNGVRLTPKEK